MIPKVRKERNPFVDIMRGIAMLMVVLGHTMTGCTVDSQKSFLFNIIWSLQMPLFILISGYVTKYSRAICNGTDLWKYVKRRTVSYMLPWAVWSFLIRGLLFGQTAFWDIKNLLWNMDSGYWFLVTIWTISMVFGAASYLAECFGKSGEMRKQTVLLLCYLAGMILLVGIGMIMGISFFAIKLTLYYMPFYYAGYLYGQIDDKLMSTKQGKTVVDCCIALCFAIWLYVILRISLYEMSDNGIAIILRAGTSLAGCIAICGLLNGVVAEMGGGTILGWKALSGDLSYTLFTAEPGQAGQLAGVSCPGRDDDCPGELFIDRSAGYAGYSGNQPEQNACVYSNRKERLIASFRWIGTHSLEIYMIHGLFLNIFKSITPISFCSIPGYLLTAGNFLLTVGICAFVINLLRKNAILKKVLSIR